MSAVAALLPAQLRRTVFATSRAAEFLERRALQSQTGQPVERFAQVVLKELLDNALDAAESAGVHPEISIIIDTTSAATLTVTVADNGPGLPPEVVEQVLDFNVLVSDKAAYRSPTRGLQGNALKTIVGIPFALGVDVPVVIEARGVRHEIAVSLDPGGNVVVRHDRQPSARTVGTAVTVTLPRSAGEDELDEFDPAGWARSFALVNPHAAIQLAYTGEPGPADSYKSTVGEGWSKPVPSDPHQIHWYDQAALTRLVFTHIGAAEAGGRDLPVGEFVRQFAGLTSTIKAKKVAAALPNVTHLSDLRTAPQQIPVLLAAMQDNCRAPKPTVLGSVPEEHYRQVLDRRYGVRRWWFKRKPLVVDGAGLPWVIEVAVADTEEPGDVFYAVNYSPTFGDPLSRTSLRSPEGTTTEGAASFLLSCDALPDFDNDGCRAVVVHLISPAMEFVDKGKVALVVPPAVAEAAAGVLAFVAKTLRTETQAAQRDARKAQRHREQRRQRVARVNAASSPSLRDAVFSVLPESYAKASGPDALPVSDRTLYYQVRQAIQQFTDRELTQSYCSKLVVDYQREHGAFDGLYYEPRGELHEPHTGKVVPLGTREVRTYIPPDWTYDKILYVEKQGLYPVLKASGLGERYDMAIIAGEGYADVACRDLLATAEGRNLRIFALHDADPAGYNIARTLAEATERMPGHRVDVVDLGLSVADAVTQGLPTEAFTRKKALPATLSLTDTEYEWFTGTQAHWGDKPQWACTRVELNAFTGPQLVAYIEAGLEAHDATGKVIPPDHVLTYHAQSTYDIELAKAVDELLAELIDRDRLLATVASEMPYKVDATKLRAHVTERLAKHRQLPWRAPNGDDAAIRIVRNREQLRSRLVDLLAAQRGQHDEDGWSQ
ncbi:MAG: ATP-binding protein [Pseudonocardiaceae bacterium]